MAEEIKSPEVKAVIGFGTKSALAGPTPKAIQLFYRILLFCGGLWALIIQPQFPQIPSTVAHSIDKWVLIGNTLIYFLCQFFGWIPPKDASKQTTSV